MTAAMSMRPRDLLLAILVVAMWGTNFVIVQVSLSQIPPLLFATLRFALAFLPAAIFVKRPSVSWTNLISYGVIAGAGQFGLLYTAMNGHISPGLASLVMQMQVFFTIFLSVWLTGERIGGFQWLALALGASGIGVIALHIDATTTPLGLGLVLLAALSWAACNLIVRTSGTRDMVAYVVWASLFATPPLLVLSLWLEGPTLVLRSLGQADMLAWASVIWQGVGNTLFGYAAWGWLLTRYPAAIVTPTALLIPVFGILSSVAFLQESFTPWKLAATLLVMGGLALILLRPLEPKPRSIVTAASE